MDEDILLYKQSKPIVFGFVRAGETILKVGGGKIYSVWGGPTMVGADGPEIFFENWSLRLAKHTL